MRTTFLIIISMIGVPAFSQISNQGDAFKAGKDFAQGASGKDAAKGSISTTGGQANVPKYNTTAPEGSVFGGGKSPIGSFGTQKQGACQTSVAPTAYDQQECDAVNFMTKNPGQRPKYVIDKKNDPLIVGSTPTINNPGTIPGSSGSVCREQKTTIPGTFKVETCETSTAMEEASCSKQLIPQCAYTGSNITSSNLLKTGIFNNPTLTNSGTVGLYDYLIQVPNHQCRTSGTATIEFNFDTVGFGSYITVEVSSLDDTAAVAVNGTTIFAGHPNSGPQYSSESFFPTSRADFSIGYTWSEDNGNIICTQSDNDGNCTATAWNPVVQQFTADVKLLDYCPSGYTPQKQSQLVCEDCGLNTNTIYNYSGFFCNSEGKFLLNRREGGGSWGGTVNRTMPLVAGKNNITAYWGTYPAGDSCGQVTVKGRIYNVAPKCATSWDDTCASLRAAVQSQ